MPRQQETRERGITSASFYRAHSNRTCVLCTTSPSTERWRNQGEWSFSLPVLNTTVPVLKCTTKAIHNFEQFRKHRALVAGAVSSRHNVLAVLEETGKIYILRLDAHEDGGIHSPELDAGKLAVRLAKQETPSANCLRFDPDGERLFAVDIKGKIIIVEFEKV